jgi:16S rRNA processing protein RimM
VPRPWRKRLDELRSGGATSASAARLEPVKVRVSETSAYLVVGKIVGAHGVRGEVKVTSQTDNPDRFRPGVELLLESEAGLQPVKIVTVRPHKGMLLIKLASVPDRSSAEQLQWRKLLIPASEGMALGEHENFVHDLIGLSVETSEGETLGELTEILVTPANDVYVVSGPRGQLLLPALRSVVLRVDLTAGKMTVEVPEGLRDSISSA